ncbi:MAG: hypothetical protein U9R51_01110, partial [Actinomycetota bacterium]|nr:hypothetical protein [Actinomycetota bacterium]
PGKQSISHVRSRIPLVFAGLLIIALIATIGLAAFTPGSTDSTTDTIANETLDMDLPISGRIASAVLALAVAPERDADLATSTTIAVAEPDSEASDAPATEPTVDTTAVAEDDEAASDATESSDAAVTASTEQVTTTNAPKTDTTPPAIQVLSPKDGATVTNRVIEFTGVAERGAEVFSGPFEAEVDNGEWSINLVLAPGANGATFTARDAAGNEATVRITVTYDAPESTTVTTQAPTTTKPPSSSTPTTTQAPTTTTTKPAATSSGYSPLWPADAAGRRDVEAWRSDVQAHWASDRVDCVLGIIKLESGGDPTASNGGRYLGLMQHSATYWPSRAKGAGFVDDDGLIASPFNAEANIAAGAYLADYYDRIGKDWRSPWTVWSSVSACQS